MILKVFTKRTKGGDLVDTGLEWKDAIYEADKFLRKPTNLGFEMAAVGLEGYDRILIDTSVQGYEILNDAGVRVERYVTPVQNG